MRPVVEALTAVPHELIELPAAAHFDSPALVHLERTLFDERPPRPAPPADGAVVLLEACGVRGVADQVAAEALALDPRAAPSPARSRWWRPRPSSWRLALEGAFVAAGVPIDVDAPVLLAETAFGQALLGLLRFAWFDGDRGELFRFLRSPFAGVPRATVDYAEGRLRGRGALLHDDVRDTLEELDYTRLLVAPERLGQAGDPVAQVTDQVGRMSAAAGGLTARRLGAAGERHAAALRAVLRTLEQLAQLTARGFAAPDRAALAGELERTAASPRRARARARGRARPAARAHPPLPGGVRARPGGGRAARRRPRERLPRRRRGRPAGHRTGSTRSSATATSSTPPSPAPGGGCTCAGRRPTRTAGCSSPRRSWRTCVRAMGEHAARAPPPCDRRPHLRARGRRPPSVSGCARSPASSGSRPDWAAAVADRQGWTRKLERARTAYRRPSRLRNPAVLAALAAQERFSVTELEKFAECSSAWFVERFLQPGEIDYEFGPKETGSVAHTALHRFHERMPGELGIERLSEDDLPRAVPLMRRCLQEALASVRIPAGAAGKESVRRLERDLEGFLRSEAAFASPLVPRDFEVRFGTKSSPPNLQQGLRLDGFAVSGTIDRIDRDPGMSARGAVWDYKSGKGAKSAVQIENERKLQLPLYILVVRDLLGIEPVAGLYRALAGERKVRGMAVKGELEGVIRTDQLEPADFWAQVDRAVGYANEIVARVRRGDVRRDPIGGTCPEWCLRQAGGICRVER